jgi:uncharacterized protein
MNKVEIVQLATCPSIAWRNGYGSMQLLAAHPPDAGTDDFHWRISIATVAQDSPFSAFPGYDRCIALLGGHGMVLSSPESGMEQRLDSLLQPLHFAGETVINARLIDGPLHNLSILARRGCHRIELNQLEIPNILRLSARQTPLLVQCLAGKIEVNSENHESFRLQGGELALWRSGAPELLISSTMKETQVISVDLFAV